MSFITDLNAVQRVVINNSAGTSITPITGVANKRVRIIALELTADPADTIEIKSSGGATLSGPQKWAAKVFSPCMLKDLNIDWYISAVGEGITITKTAGTQLSGVIHYTQE